MQACTTPKDKLKAEQDDYLEEALEETFPASDPITPGQVEFKSHGSEAEPREDEGSE
ncbi:hypothetical protein FHX08_005576 [Rhizobium sp. BK529]|uniref:hypothetical protein n=1 Tax=Rhizobium sp. BK529 TaxID=2586983 RepID=UPI001607A248|nr:hypothetical protein [Rhizobium sp. BK529]MBB3595166.1 hypothetical protein [Rhizobium sp. BK529]